MRIVAHHGARLHAPEDSIAALISGYTSGADVLEFGLQLTRDSHLVLSRHATIDAMTGAAGAVGDLMLAELREFDFSRRFQPRNSPNFRFFGLDVRRLALATFPEVLEILPEEVELLIELGDLSSSGTARRDELVRRVAEGLSAHVVAERSVVTCRDPETLRALRAILPSSRICTDGGRLELMARTGADGLVVSVDDLVQGDALTPLALAIERAFRQNSLRVGAVVQPPQGGVFTESQWRVLRDKPFVWSIGTESLLDVPFVRRSVTLIDEPFAGSRVDRDHFALGYAKANRYCSVTQDDGIHVRIVPFPEILPPPTDQMERRIQHIEERLIDVAREWPFYSGGGVGYVPGIRGDFAAEVDYTVDNVAQATTLEMAVVNVDPGAHQSRPPTSFRNKDSFYDPHGAPPFVGVEHDEDDGYRINWNLGSEYDSNQYGRPVGDGKTPRAARLRLERRGSFFAAYYRNSMDARDWVCCGVVRNESLNRVVFLRCVGKRWRQESESNPLVFVPIVPNHFVFKNLRIERYLR